MTGFKKIKDSVYPTTKRRARSQYRDAATGDKPKISQTRHSNANAIKSSQFRYDKHARVTRMAVTSPYESVHKMWGNKEWRDSGHRTLWLLSRADVWPKWLRNSRSSVLRLPPLYWVRGGRHCSHPTQKGYTSVCRRTAVQTATNLNPPELLCMFPRTKGNLFL